MGDRVDSSFTKVNELLRLALVNGEIIHQQHKAYDAVSIAARYFTDQYGLPLSKYEQAKVHLELKNIQAGDPLPLVTKNSVVSENIAMYLIELKTKRELYYDDYGNESLDVQKSKMLKDFADIKAKFGEDAVLEFLQDRIGPIKERIDVKTWKPSGQGPREPPKRPVNLEPISSTAEPLSMPVSVPNVQTDEYVSASQLTPAQVKASKGKGRRSKKVTEDNVTPMWYGGGPSNVGGGPSNVKRVNDSLFASSHLAFVMENQQAYDELVRTVSDFMTQQTPETTEALTTAVGNIWSKAVSYSPQTAEDFRKTFLLPLGKVPPIAPTNNGETDPNADITVVDDQNASVVNAPPSDLMESAVVNVSPPSEPTGEMVNVPPGGAANATMPTPQSAAASAVSAAAAAAVAGGMAYQEANRQNPEERQFDRDGAAGPNDPVNDRGPALDALKEAAKNIKLQVRTNVGGSGGGGAQTQTMQEEPVAKENTEMKTVLSSSTRQDDLPASELASLISHVDYTEQLNPEKARLLLDKHRGNAGAGTAADHPSADLWGYLPSQHRPDIEMKEWTLKTNQDGSVVPGDTPPDVDKFSLLPFAKLNGQLIWIPRHAVAARFYFTSENYQELVSYIVDGEQLTLREEQNLNPAALYRTIQRIHFTLSVMCMLSPMLDSTSTVQQLYAEWLELREMSKALHNYEMNTAGMFENASTSMRGGIRAAVLSALKPLYIALSNGSTAGMDMNDGSVAPSNGTMYERKRQREGIIEPEEYNPQFTYEPIEFKKVKFSIPHI